MKKFILLFLSLLAFASPAAAQLDLDGRVNPAPGDRIAVYCKTTFIEVWGVTNLSTGVLLARISYTDLFSPGVITRNTDNGQVIADGQSNGMIDVQWFGGPYYASGFGDFAKWVNCNVAVVLPSTGTTTTPTAQRVSANTTLTQTSTTGTTVVVEASITNSPGAVVNQSVSINTDSTTCGSRSYTVQSGDTLFRIGLRFGTTFQHLAYCNSIADPTRIYVGQVIVVP